MKDARWVSRVDWGCQVFVTKDWIEEQKQHCDCNNCEYKQYARGCMSQILNAFTNPIIAEYLKIRKDISYDFLVANPDLFPSLK